MLDSLCAGLEQAGIDVLLDRTRLTPGAAWRREIYAWLGLCHAAVILISRRALDDVEKYWVAREATLLVWRQALDPTLKLIPVLLPGVDPRELAGGRFADLQLREIQCLMANSDPALTIAEVMGALPYARGVVNTTPLDALAGQISARLRHFDLHAIDHAAALLGFDLGQWRPDGDAMRDLALALSCAPFEQAACALEYLAECGSKLARTDLAEIAGILGANWVDPEAARWLAFDGPAGHAAVLNASTQFAAEAYVQRACGKPPPARWPLIPLTGVTGEATEEEIRAEVEAALARAIPLVPDAFGPGPAVRRRRLLEQRRKQGLPLFLLARLPADPHPFVRGLRVACPGAAPFFLAADLTQTQADELDASFRVLRPLLEPEADLEAQTRADDLMFRLAS
jgi:hypothetical protein